MSAVRVNEGAVRRFFQSSPLAGVGVPGLRSGSAERLAERAVRFAEREVESTFHERTGELRQSLRAIVRTHAGGGVEIGVGSTAPHAKYLEDGTIPHEIRPVNARFLVSTPDNPTPLRGRRLRVSHPGNRAYGFLRKSLALATGRVPISGGP